MFSTVFALGFPGNSLNRCHSMIWMWCVCCVCCLHSRPVSSRLRLFHRYLNMSHVLQLGGVNEDIPYIYPQLQHKHFTGCIRNLIVDSKVTAAAAAADSGLSQADKWINNGFQHPCCPHANIRAVSFGAFDRKLKALSNVLHTWTEREVEY